MTRTQIDDNLLVAYADGELGPATNREIELLALRDPAVQARIAMFRRSAELLREALSGPEALAVPPPLATAVERIPGPGGHRRRAAGPPLAKLNDPLRTFPKIRDTGQTSSGRFS